MATIKVKAHTKRARKYQQWRKRQAITASALMLAGSIYGYATLRQAISDDRVYQLDDARLITYTPSDHAWWNTFAQYDDSGHLIVDRSITLGEYTWNDRDFDLGGYRMTDLTPDLCFDHGRGVVPVLSMDEHRALFRVRKDEYNDDLPIAMPVGPHTLNTYPYVVYRPDKKGQPCLNTRHALAHDVTSKSGSDAPMLAVLGVAIVTNTTTATKTAGIGCLTQTCVGSTLGTGRYDEHEFHWANTTYQDGHAVTIADPRPGAQEGATINARDGDFYGNAYASPLLVSGNLGSTCYGEDYGGNTDNATASNLSVAAFSGTEIYCDGDATGANDGTSWGDAYADINDALDDVGTTGDDVILYLKSGQTYTLDSNAILTGDNISIITDDLDTETILECYNGGTSYRIAFQECENVTYAGLTVGNGGEDGSTDVVAISNGVEDLRAYKVKAGDTGYKITAFIALTSTTDMRVMLQECDSTTDPYSSGQSGAFYEGEVLVVLGGEYVQGSTAGEDTFRINSDDSMCSFVGVDIDSTIKSCIRFRSSTHSVVSRCKLVYSDTAYAGRVVMMNGANYPGGASNDFPRIARNYLSGSDRQIAVIDWDLGGGTANHCGTIAHNVLISNASSATGRGLNAGGAYSITFIGNTFYGTSDNQFCRLPVDQDHKVIGNIFKYTGASSNHLIAQIGPTGTQTATHIIEDNVVDTTNLTSNTWKYYGTSYTTANLDINVSGATDNSDAAVTLDADFLPSSIGTYTGSGGLDYYNNDLSASRKIGAVDSVPTAPTAPTIDELSPADDGTATESNSLVIHFNEDAAYNDGSALIEVYKGGVSVASARVDSGTLNASDKSEWTKTGMLTGLSGDLSVRISPDGFKSLATGIAFAGIEDDTTWNFNISGSGSPTTNRSRVRDGLRRR